MKVHSSKRPDDFEGGGNHKAPEDFQAEAVSKSEVLETIAPLPAANRTIEIAHISSLAGDDIVNDLPSCYRESMVTPQIIVEEKEEYVYEVPENKRLKFKELVEQLEKKTTADDKEIVRELEVKLLKSDDHSWEGIDKLMRAICKKHNISPKKLHNDFKSTHNMIPDEWISQQKPKAKPKTAIEELASKIVGEVSLNEETEVSDGARIINLEKQVESMRKLVLEMGQGTIVHGLGVGSPGSGEVNLNRMDDVDVRGIADGSTLIWDEELQKWLPSGAQGVHHPGGNQEILDKVNSLEQVIFSLQEFVSSHTHLGDGGPIDEGHTHGTTTRVLTYEGTTDRTGARQVDFEDESTAFIIAEESIDLDHFHSTMGDVFLIEVENSTTFSVDDHAHVPSWVSMEAYSDYNTVAREVSWDASDGTLLLALEETNAYNVDFTDSIIVELETNTLSAGSSTAQVFGVEVSTNISAAASFDWDDDVNLLSPEGIVNPGDLSSAGDGTFVGLEDGVESQPIVNLNSNTSVTPGEFFDNTPGGDISRFRVTVNPSRRVYRLDGIDQPAIQVPRGDIIEFDLTAVEDRDEFVIYVDGAELETGITRYPTLLSLDTSKLTRNINKAYYRHRTVRGMGWIIVIADN